MYSLSFKRFKEFPAIEWDDIDITHKSLTTFIRND